MNEEKQGASEPKGFKVTDRRHFVDRPEGEEEAAGGESPSPEPAAEPSPPPPSPPSAAASPGTAAGPGTGAAPAPGPGVGPQAPSAGGAPEPIDFVHLVLSLVQTALFQLGEIPDPATGKGSRDLTAASQTIDILGILKEKTAGNLTADEQRILGGYLTELRTRFLAASKQA